MSACQARQLERIRCVLSDLPSSLRIHCRTSIRATLFLCLCKSQCSGTMWDVCIHPKKLDMLSTGFRDNFGFRSTHSLRIALRPQNIAPVRDSRSGFSTTAGLLRGTYVGTRQSEPTWALVEYDGSIMLDHCPFTPTIPFAICHFATTCRYWCHRAALAPRRSLHIHTRHHHTRVHQ